MCLHQVYQRREDAAREPGPVVSWILTGGLARSTVSGAAMNWKFVAALAKLGRAVSDQSVTFLA